MKILLIVLSKRQYEHHVEYWNQKGCEIIATTSLDEALIYMEKNKDISVVLIEPVLSKPVGHLLEKRIIDHTPEFSAQSGGEKAFGMMFWFNLLRCKRGKITTFFLATDSEKEIMVNGLYIWEMRFITVPSGPESILKMIELELSS